MGMISNELFEALEERNNRAPVAGGWEDEEIRARRAERAALVSTLRERRWSTSPVVPGFSVVNWESLRVSFAQAQKDHETAIEGLSLAEIAKRTEVLITNAAVSAILEPLDGFPLTDREIQALWGLGHSDTTLCLEVLGGLFAGLSQEARYAYAAGRADHIREQRQWNDARQEGVNERRAKREAEPLYALLSPILDRWKDEARDGAEHLRFWVAAMSDVLGAFDDEESARKLLDLAEELNMRAMLTEIRHEGSAHDGWYLDAVNELTEAVRLAQEIREVVRARDEAEQDDLD